MAIATTGKALTLLAISTHLFVDLIRLNQLAAAIRGEEACHELVCIAYLRLATYRLSLMLSSEEGPLAIFARLRRKVPPKTNPGRGVRCFVCWSVWIAAAITVYLLWLGTITKELSPLYWFAASGAAVIIHCVVER